MSRKPKLVDRFDGKKKVYRTHCFNCRTWITMSYKGRAENNLCPDCKKLKRIVEKPAMFRAERQVWWKVIECPDEYGYKPGAAFSNCEISEMKNNWTLIPGMVMEKKGVRYIAVSENRIKEQA